MQKQIIWIDILRVVACFMVVISHSCDFFVEMLGTNRIAFLSGAGWGSAVRASVPLFVMISGVLLLPVKTTMTQFYKKRLGRILFPLIIWSLITPFFYWIYGTINAKDVCYNIISFPINFNYTTIPLWYLYMLVGIYLMLPIISAWVEKATRKELKIFLLIWGFTLLLPMLQFLLPMVGYVGNYDNMGIFGECGWNTFGTFYYFSGFLGYVLLAHYLVKYPLNMTWKKTLLWALPMFVVGYATTFWGFDEIHRRFPEHFAYLEIIWSFNGLNVALMTLAIFMIIQKMKCENIKSPNFFTQLSSLTFGIYLSHFFIVKVVHGFITSYIPTTPYFQIPLIALIAFAASALLIWCIKKLPFSKYIIG